MSLTEIQEEVDRWISQFKEGYWTPHQIYAQLGEEVGEVGREINHLYGPKSKKPGEETRSLEEELGDVIFTLCCLANSKGIKLDEAFRRTMNKCYGRDNERFEKK